MFDLSRLSTGKLTLSMADVDVCAVVNSICDMARTEATGNNNLELTVNGTQTPIIIHADPVRVEQIIWNLINNAVKFTPPDGSIRVGLTREAEAVRLDVIDTGQGIAPEFLPYVFDIYRQAGPPTTRTKGGLGIGLSLVKQLINLHGGRVEAESAGLEKGARFSVWFPLRAATTVDNGPAAAPSESRLARLRIMLVDDNKESVLALKSLLEMKNAIVISATDVASALRMLEENEVDLLISDVAMPEVDGYEFIKQIRNRPQSRNLPAIAITGMGRASDVARALQGGSPRISGNSSPSMPWWKKLLNWEFIRQEQRLAQSARRVSDSSRICRHDAVSAQVLCQIEGFVGSL